jgi:hypothetical protein
MAGRDPCKGLRRQLAAHRRKLREFQADPFAHDSAGVLARSPPEQRDKIIRGRIRKLQRQKNSFTRQLEQCARRHRSR